MKKRIKLLCALLLSILVIGCGKKSSEVSSEMEYEYREFIEAYTQGYISRNASLHIVLTRPSEQAKPGQEESEQLFKLSPKVEGTTVWLDNVTLEFHPKEPLERGREYEVTFNLGKVADLGTNDQLSKFVYSVKVKKQNISVDMQALQLTDEGEYQKRGRVYLSDDEDLDDVKACFSAKLLSPSKKELEMEWTSSEMNDGSYFSGPTYDFVVKGFDSNLKKSQTFEVAWDGKSIGSESNDKVVETIDYVNGFRLTDINVENSGQPYVKLYFSQAIKANQEWRTYVKIDGQSASYTRDGNMLMVYPENPRLGNNIIRVFAGLKSVQNDVLENDTVINFNFESLKPAVRLVRYGTILPKTENASLPFQAVNLKKVDVSVLKIFSNNMLQFLQNSKMSESDSHNLRRTGRMILQKTIDLTTENESAYANWRTFSLDLSELAKEDPGAMYRIYFSFKRAYSTYPCEVNDSIDDSNHDYCPISAWDFNKDQEEYYWSYYDYEDEEGTSDGSGDYSMNWSEREDPSKISYYLEHNKVSTNVFVSNFGVTAKGGKSNFYDVFVTDILTVQPASGVKVKFYDFQQQIIAESTTDGEGMVKEHLSRTPSFLVLEKGGQMGYLRLRDNSALSLSSFDVSGASNEKGVKGYIYGERGVWRPGDTLNISLLVQDADETLPAGHPINMELKTPRGQRYATATQKYDPSNCIYSFRIPTRVDDQTGNWRVNFAIGGSSFSKSLMVETVKPNRLKVQMKPVHTYLTPGMRETFNIHSEWLHGGTASYKEVNVKMRYMRDPEPFEKFPGFVFESPDAKKFSSEEEMIIEGSLDESGDLSTSVDMPTVVTAPGMLKALLTTRVDEGTGDFSVNFETVPFSPYNRYVGVKYPQMKGGAYIVTNKPQTFQLALVDAKGQPLSGDGISFKLYRMSWHWWWDGDSDDNEAYYTENVSPKPYFEKNNIKFVNGRANVEMNVPDADWGRYQVVVSDGKKGHKAGGIIHFDWDNWYLRSQSDSKSGATMLTFALDKEKYQVGEKVKVTLPTPEAGRILVTVENRTKVITSKWIDVQAGSTSFEVDVTAEMLPNAYLYVNLLQPYAKTANDLPIRQYGVQNFMVESQESILTPVLNVPDKVESEEEFEVKVSEQNGKEMCYTLAIVDNGLLDLTNFKTPNAHNEFFKREALGVNSWDMYDLVFGAYGGKIEQLFAIGGDMAMGRDGLNKRFDPVVKFIGPVKLKAGEKKTHKVKLPPYFGSVRVMVVAGNKAAYGNAEKDVKVTKALMVLPTAPRVVGPNETFSLPVNVFTMDGQPKNVTVSVSTAGKIQVVGNAKISQRFNGSEDKILVYNMKVGKGIGKEKIIVTATDGTNNVKSEINLEVRNPNLRFSKTYFYEIPAGGSKECAYELFGSEGTNQLILDMSPLPSIDVSGSMRYLIGYPHGCAEQTSSKAFPQLLLPELAKLTDTEKAECVMNVKAAIFKLSQMQMPSGAFSYWMGGNYDYPWVTNYAGHFLLEAKKLGYDVPNSVIMNFCTYQKRAASSWGYRSSDDQGDYVQAYRLYTLALAGKEDLSAMNRLKELKLSNPAKWRLAAAYALCGKMDVAKSLAKTANFETPNSYSDNTFGSSMRDKAMILDAMVLIGIERETSLKMLKEIAETMKSGKQFNTQELAHNLVAYAHFAKSQAASQVNATCVKDGKSIEFSGDKSVVKGALEVGAKDAQKFTLKNNGKGVLFASLSVSGIPEGDAMKAYEKGISLENVVYKDLDGDIIDPKNIQQGTDFYVQATVRNNTGLKLNEVAMTQVFPSGWEIQNDRLSGDDQESVEYSYRDVRDDRVMTYFSLSSSGSYSKKTFKVKLHASFVGKYFAPAIICESMYDSDVCARNNGFWTEVSE